MTATTKGLIATVILLGLLLLGFIIYQVVSYLKNRPPRLLDPNVRMDFGEVRNRPTHATTIGKPILKTPTELRELPDARRSFVDNLRHSTCPYKEA